MLTNYLKVISRSFLKNKAYTLINLVGLTSGMVVFLLIIIYVNYEFSFDQYHENKDRIYKVYKQDHDNFYQGDNRFGVTPAPLAPTLMEEYPEVEYATRISGKWNVLVEAGDDTFFERSLYMADPEVFKIFTFEYLKGDPSSYLKDRYTVVVSESMAKKYFGDEDPMGKAIYVQDQREGKMHAFRVDGVIKDMPKNSHFAMNAILHYESVMEMDRRDLEAWNNNSFHTYLLLAEGFNPDDLEDKFPALREKYADDKIDEDGQKTNYYLQLFSKMHLYSDVQFDIAQSNDATKLYIYSTIAFLILIIACINYMNLATAQSIKRAKEVGIRKVAGANKTNLVFQFLGESMVLTLLSLIVSLIAITFLLPHFGEFVGRELSLNFKQNPQLILILIGTFLLVGITSGSYPALALSSYKPISVLKGKYGSRSSGSTLRNILVIIQFAISGTLIISTLIVSKQLNYIQNKEMGYARDQIVILRIRDRDLRSRLAVFKDELRKLPGVLKVASSSSLPNDITSSTNANWPGRPEDVQVPIYTGSADYDFLDLYEMEIVEGRSFSREYGDDKGAIMINESAVNALGWENPLERELIRRDTLKIVGIMKDFHQHSLHLGIKPLQIYFSENHSNVSVKIDGERIPETLAAIENTYNSFSEKYPFYYEFFDDLFNQAYKSEQTTGKLANWFTALTIIIACLGLYGLASFITEQRIKEVGIRKVLGASVRRILILLTRDFTFLVLASFMIAIPIAYFAMEKWLSDFAFRIEIGATVFLSTLVMMVLIAWLTVGYKTYKAAITNPVNSLRDE